MYQIDKLKRSLQEIAKLRGQMAQIESTENRAQLRELSCYVRIASIHTQAAISAIESLERLLTGVWVDTGTESRTKMPYWVLTVPAKVALTCPLCCAVNECDVNRDDDIDEKVTACYAADIDTDSCEDCGMHLCPKCPRFPHPDDKDLIRCGKCAAEVSHAEPSTPCVEGQATTSTKEKEPTYYCGSQYCDDPVCGTHGSDWVEWRKEQ